MSNVLTLLAALILSWIIVSFAGIWSRPSLHDSGLLQRAADIVRMIEAASPAQREVLAEAVSNPEFQVHWVSVSSPVRTVLESASPLRAVEDFPSFEQPGRRGRIVHFTGADHQLPSYDWQDASAKSASSHYLGVGVNDGSWVLFAAPNRFWGVGQPMRIGIELVLLIVAIIGASALATYQLARPIRIFADGLRRFGADPKAPPIVETGPSELRANIRAFNKMQAQVQSFISERTMMLAAISHDLRTPLTKVRLRGEFIDDPEQRTRLFRDVDDMQAMIGSALSFFVHDQKDEETTAFDFPELLRSIADDFCDQGTEIAYRGPGQGVYRGRPFALKRAFTNLVENAAKYGEAAALELHYTSEQIVVKVIDSGPGIPPAMVEQVFAPFYRLERSRNRSSGGVGLGLTSARAVIRAHGGDITLANRPSGGLEARIVLPISS